MNTPTVTAATIIDWGDVVNVVYSLFEDPGHQTAIVSNGIPQLISIYLKLLGVAFMYMLVIMLMCLLQ